MLPAPRYKPTREEAFRREVLARLGRGEKFSYGSLSNKPYRHMVTLDGVEKSITDWANHFGVGTGRISWLLARSRKTGRDELKRWADEQRGMAPEEEEPPAVDPRCKLITLGTQTKTINGWAAHFGVSGARISQLLCKGRETGEDELAKWAAKRV